VAFAGSQHVRLASEIDPQPTQQHDRSARTQRREPNAGITPLRKTPSDNAATLTLPTIVRMIIAPLEKWPITTSFYAYYRPVDGKYQANVPCPSSSSVARPPTHFGNKPKAPRKDAARFCRVNPPAITK
jgi:hypothetical protein